MKFLLTFCLLFSLLSATAQITYDQVFVDYDSAWQFKNLKIIPIRRKAGGGMMHPGMVTLNQALSKGLVTVTERGTTSFENVHWLRFNTHTDKSVYISGGEIISGGRQDRMIVRDTILKPSTKDQYVPVMCVEEGRWSEKEKKFGYGNFANPHLRKVLDSTGNQVSIWREVDRQLQAGAFKNKSLAYLSRFEDKKYLAAHDEYFRFFMNKFAKTDSNVVGFVAITGDKIIGTDVFDGTDLFYPQLDPLLHGYVDDAMESGSPVTLKNAPVKKYMDKLLKDQQSQENFVKDKGKIFREDGRVIHVNTYTKETPVQ
ncbi:ARPP-1 family domain-containing protein [Puia dinghuensis]|uniref:ARG and Rhodanese-Phosphatase-superfamily-associated domain-containing protein n=1 Tax=Puia dinghuensis TaxID=1792502 RepID=A0A8J2UH13_9BACT|nr:DUF6569 family protein [Puia dinghuensis]GGB14492.1 hypothetical protein GCM10011511_42910 [Puia dinghuensis]